jgi:CheY-like chemotaxis protein
MATTLDRPDRLAGISRDRPRLAGVRVLAVDDDYDALEILAALLEQAGAEVRVARSAADALAALRVWWPTVIVSDIGMPGQNGYELIGAIRSLPGGDRIPAAAVTGHSQREDRARAFAAGFQAHIPKPADADELVAALVHLARVAR